MSDVLAAAAQVSVGALGAVWILIAIALLAVVGRFTLRWYLNLPRYTHEALRPDKVRDEQ